MEPGLEALLGEALPLLPEDKMLFPSPVLPLGLGVFFRDSSFPHQSNLCSDGLTEDFEGWSLQQPWSPRGEFTGTEPRGWRPLPPEKFCVYISVWALIPPAPTASPVTALPSLGQGSWSDTMEAGFFGWVIRPSLDLGVQKDKEGGGREGEGEREEGEGCHYLLAE